MHKIDQNACLKCGACAGTCPLEAIIEKDGGYEVTEACADCGACEDACPVGAIKA